MLNIFLISLAVLALLSIIFEEVTHLNKTKTTLFFGCISWIVLFISAGDPSHEKLVEAELKENLL